MNKSQEPRPDLKYWVALNHFIKFGPAKFKRLRKYFPNMEAAFNSNFEGLKKAGIEENLANEFLSTRPQINPDQIMARVVKENLNVMVIGDENYPELLSEIYDPPPIFYYRGELDNYFNIAIVGSRKHTSYGKNVTEEIARGLAQNNVAVVSGLALGIDAIAHSTAIEAGGKTIAVLGAGLDRQSIYPSSHRYLADKIEASGGAVISEFPLGAPALRHHFPQRNRIISGLSRGVLVIEAGENSGSLITAKCALEQNREVFAVPGSIYSNVSSGTNKLIKDGAISVTSVNDIIEALDLKQAITHLENKKIIPASREEEVILAHLSREPRHVNELIRLSTLDTRTINSTLIIMEMKGMVKNLGGMNYVIS
jgi:DNA processing protein